VNSTESSFDLHFRNPVKSNCLDVLRRIERYADPVDPAKSPDIQIVR